MKSGIVMAVIFLAAFLAAAATVMRGDDPAGESAENGRSLIDAPFFAY